MRLDYATLEHADANGGAEWILPEAATVNGLAIWFETTLTAGIGFSSAPGSMTRVYKQTYLPLREPVAVIRGDRLRVQLSLRLVANEYVWAWTVWVTPAAGGLEREVVRQNSIAEGILDPEWLHRHARLANGV